MSPKPKETPATDSHSSNLRKHLATTKTAATYALVPLVDDYESKRVLSLKYSNPTTIRKAIDKYFEARAALNIPHTIAGLALTLGTSTNNLRAIAAGERGEEIAAVIGELKKARVQREIQKALARLADVFESDMRARSSSTIANLFLLKNLGYSDNSGNDKGLTIRDNSGQPLAVQVIRYSGK